ncbi:MAG: tRNA (adenosine(37)-N6)-threonylcarbamoyltransferase complex dimerization subunit type 1 TsaB [Gallionella sp.]|nr:tRNA (adenosine(37)-N6)-threonylcarbamoyltransferase complex dimerization subunit type 1 TsaB [Gallionella sp.]
MKIFALETSTEYCSVALWQDGAVTDRCELAGQKHSERLISMIDALLQDAGYRIQDMDGIAYGAGPGSFTGVRIACGATQGLALGANLPVSGICTLQALAQGSGQMRVIAALDARMGEIYCAAYERAGEGWMTVYEPCLCKAEDAPALTGEGWFGIGSGFAAYAEGLCSRYEGQLSGMDSTAVPQASHIAALAAVQFSIGAGMDAAQAQPFYLRDKVALKTVEREALARAQALLLAS